MNMKPPEILGLLEEASGTKLYERKKEAAVRTLEKKAQKLAEVDQVWLVLLCCWVVKAGVCAVCGAGVGERGGKEARWFAQHKQKNHSPLLNPNKKPTKPTHQGDDDGDAAVAAAPRAPVRAVSRVRRADAGARAAQALPRRARLPQLRAVRRGCGVLLVGFFLLGVVVGLLISSNKKTAATTLDLPPDQKTQTHNNTNPKHQTNTNSAVESGQSEVEALQGEGAELDARRAALEAEMTDKAKN